MKRIFIFILLVYGFTLSIFSQPAFIVITSKDVLVKKGSDWTKAVVGLNLNSTDILKAEKGGKANLLHKSGKMILFSSINETQISDFEKKMKPLRIFGSLSGQLGSALTEKIEKRVSKPPAGATRSTPFSKEIFMITPRNNTKIFELHPVFAWNKFDEEKEYKLSISEFGDDVTLIKEIKINDTIYHYSEKDPQLKRGKNYICSVQPKNSNKQSELQVFSIADEKDYTDIKQKIDLINEMCEESDEIGKNIMLGATYYDLGIYSDAFYSYLKVIKSEPKEQYYKIMFSELLEKMGLTKYSNYIWGMAK